MELANATITQLDGPFRETVGGQAESWSLRSTFHYLILVMGGEGGEIKVLPQIRHSMENGGWQCGSFQG